MTERTRVLVVGAGPAGAGLAYLLASRGVAVTLVERQRDFEREFRGEVLVPGGVRALQEMGLSEDLSRMPHQTPTSFSLHVDRRLALELPLASAAFGGQPPMILSQPHLLERLVALSETFPGFAFVRGATVRDLLREDGRIAGVSLRSDEGTREIRADLVVGADGRASVVRRKADLQPSSPDLPMDVVWCKMPWPSYLTGRPVHAYVAGGHLLIALPAPDGMLQVAWVILKGTWGALRDQGIEAWVLRMANHVEDELAAHLREHASNVARPFLLDAQADRIHGWARPGMLLIGDAAHTMSPVGGQGINVALRDAIVAANHLVAPLREAAAASALDAAAARVEPERGPEIDRIQELAALPPRLVLGTGPAAHLVRRMLPALLRLAPFRALGARAVRPFLEGVTHVRLGV